MPAGMQRITLTDGSRSITLFVEIADDPPEQERGLMERTELPKDHGMLFIFVEPQPLSFWMKNTLIPLDALFFDAAGHFVSVQTMTPCTADPCRTYSSRALAQYALEVSAGFAEKGGVGEGWKLVFAKQAQ